MSDKNKTKIIFGNGKASPEEINEVFPKLSTNDEIKREIKYVFFSDKIREESKPGFILEWGIVNCGFGTTTFVSRGNGFSIDEEAMSKESIIEIIDFLDDNFWKETQVIEFIRKYSKSEGRKGLLDILDHHYK